MKSRELDHAIAATRRILSNLSDSDWINAVGFLAIKELEMYAADIAADIFETMVERGVTSDEEFYLIEELKAFYKLY